MNNPPRASLNYIGSKHRLLPFISQNIAETCQSASGATKEQNVFSDLTFAEIFAGTGALARYMKGKVKSIVVNDLEAYSYVLNRNYLGNQAPFAYQAFIDELNHTAGQEGPIFEHYCLGGGQGRQYFSDDNGRKIDAMRQKIETWWTDQDINEDQYYFLLASLIESADKVANVASIYGAFLKHLKQTAQKPLVLRPALFNPSSSMTQVYQMDANDLIRKIEGDILYLDPPYNQRQYGANYHFLNTLALYDTFDPQGKTGLRHYERSAYCSRGQVAAAFEDLIAQARFKYIFLSYNNEGLMSMTQIEDIMSKYGRYNLKTRANYQRFKADKDGKRQFTASRTEEYLHVLIKKSDQFAYSPRPNIMRPCIDDYQGGKSMEEITVKLPSRLTERLKSMAQKLGIDDLSLAAGHLLTRALQELAERPVITQDRGQREEARTDPRLDWWREAKFGLFIHWGLYTIPAGEWKGDKIPGIGEWIMKRAEIPLAEYEPLAQQFNPIKFNAAEWVSLAKQAGQKYLVITSKHHDGFCLFNSEVGDYNIVAATPFGRDPLKELAEECQKQGLKLGFYYSQTQDWHHPDGDGNDWDFKESEKDFDDYIRNYVMPQVRELLTNYGPIGLIWFDTPKRITVEQSQALLDLCYEIQPDCLVSGRLGNGLGDYASAGDNMIPEALVDLDWETPATINDTWAYKTDDHNWKSEADLIRKLVDIVSKGGNYLLNVGPTAEGLIPQPSVERLLAMGRWLEVNGEAIYGTKPGPIQGLDWCRSTIKEGADGEPTLIYMHVFDWPAGGQVHVPGVQAAQAYLLSDSNKTPLLVTENREGVIVSGPEQGSDAIDTVIVLTN